MISLDSLTFAPPRNDTVTRDSVVSYSRERGDGLFLLRSGYARLVLTLRGRERSIRILGPGEILISAPPEHTNRSIHAVALGDLSCDFLAVRGEPHAIRLLSKAWLDIAERVTGLENRSVRAKVASTFLNMPPAWRKEGIRDLGRKTLAELSGTSPETLARVITEFQAEKIVERRGRVIMIMDLRGLEKFADE